MTRTARTIAPLLVLLLAACGGPAIQGVASVEILGGSRDVPQGSTALLTPVVTAGSGVASTVTWTSSDPAVASVDADGNVSGLLLGTTTVTATSTADPSKSDSIDVAVLVPAGTVRATYVAPEFAPAVLGAGLLMVNSGAIFTASAPVIEIETGVFGGPISSLDEDGGVNIVFPPTSELPAQLFVPAASLASVVDTFPDCELIASQPGVTVTEVVADVLPYIPLPTVFLVTAEGMYPAVASDSTFPTMPTDPEQLFSNPFVTWVNATGEVSVQTSGAGCFIDTDVEFEVDVDLAAGWNQLAWMYDWDAVNDGIGGVRLVNSAITDLHLNLTLP